MLKLYFMRKTLLAATVLVALATHAYAQVSVIYRVVVAGAVLLSTTVAAEAHSKAHEVKSADPNADVQVETKVAAGSDGFAKFVHDFEVCEKKAADGEDVKTAECSRWNFSK